jgi:hypothetical protein
MYVRCVAGCLSLFADERVTPPIPSEDSLWTVEGAGEGTILGMGGVPLEGRDAKESDDDLPF